MSLVVERIKARGQAPLFVASHTSDARVGGGLRIRFPFFGDRLVRSVGKHGEYLVEMPHRLFVAAGAQGRHRQPPEKFTSYMHGKLVDDGPLLFPKLLIGVIGL